MSRTPATVVLSHQRGATIQEVCAADAVYAVLYQGRPCKVRTHDPAQLYQGYKYGRTQFPESGHAIALARRLNLAHQTQDFTVAVMEIKRNIPLN